LVVIGAAVVANDNIGLYKYAWVGCPVITVLLGKRNGWKMRSGISEAFPRRGR
jgi:hypothetical protein